MAPSLHFVFPSEQPIKRDWRDTADQGSRAQSKANTGFGVAHGQRRSVRHPEMTSQGLLESQGRMLCAWHLAILRFAVSLDNADRLNVLAIANQIDRLGRHHEDKPNFGFFRKTSSELITAILQPGEPADAILRQYLARVDDVRLTRALVGLFRIEHGEDVAVKKRYKTGGDLWRGLPSRGTVQH